MILMIPNGKKQKMKLSESTYHQSQLVLQ